MDDLQLLEAVIGTARAAGDLLLDRLGRSRIEFKGEVDLVTEADRMAEAFLVERLRALLPEAAILAEEGGAHAGSPEVRWIVDPLDGTTNFAHGYPVFAVSVALQRAGEVTVGVVHDPTRGETFAAARGRGARRNGEALRVTSCPGIGAALLVTGFPYDVRMSERDNLAQFSSLAKRARGVRRSGSAALDLAYVAAGRFDGFWEEKLSPWDVAAGSLLVEEAGGRVTGYRGERLDLEDGHLVAAGPALHAALQTELERVERESGLPPVGRRNVGGGESR
jgi:myo-inositol-1(or 4)-monophosphatase